MDAFIGTILPWSLHRAPVGWAFCAGQQLAINQNQALYALIGSTYGGDGKTYFNLPDLRGYSLVGNGSGGVDSIGAKILGPNQNLAYGVTEPLTASKLPVHSHTAVVSGLSTTPTNINVAIPAVNGSPTTDAPSSGVNLASATVSSGDVARIYSDANADQNTLKPFTATIPALPVGGASVPITPTGASNPVLAVGVPKLFTLNFIIALVGIFPELQ